MEQLNKLTKQIVEMLDNGDLMGCYSLFEAEIRDIIPTLDQDSEMGKTWLHQVKLIDDEDWAGVMENMENIRKFIE